MMSVSAFAKYCSVSRAAVYKAGKVGRLHIVDGQLDSKARASIAYRADISRQRYQVRMDKKIGSGIYAPGGLHRSHRHKGASLRQRAGGEARPIQERWIDRAMPDGWAALALADTPDAGGWVTPLFFYPPGGKGDPIESTWAAPYTIDLESDPAAAIEADGTRHPLTIRTFGDVPWVEKAFAAAGRKTSRVGGESGTVVRAGPAGPVSAAGPAGPAKAKPQLAAGAQA